MLSLLDKMRIILFAMCVGMMAFGYFVLGVDAVTVACLLALGLSIESYCKVSLVGAYLVTKGKGDGSEKAG